MADRLPAPFVHETAVVDDGAVLEAGVKVWHFAHVSSAARVGAGSVLGHGVYLGPGVVVGRGCRIQNQVSVFEGVRLEDEVFVGPGAVFTNVATPRAHVSRRDAFLPTLVGRQATIGANATILCGNRLASRSFVAAGAVVTRDVPAGVLVMGTPARPVGWACGCGERLSGSRPPLRCAHCGAGWVDDGEGGITEETR
jgi:UDP-2-acetamido-3-amino-2,3-dideoxy-glucuronate N-acetyltransferase